MPPIRYIVAFWVACFIVGAGAIFCTNTKRAMTALLDEQRHERSIGTNSARDIEESEAGEGFDAEVPAAFIWKLDVADFLSGYGLILVPIVFVACFCVAALVGRTSGQANPSGNI